jgi:type I restriction enzyme S subunit
LQRIAPAAQVTGSACAGLPADHRRLVLSILRAHLPDAAAAWLFGSRATGWARRYSDLDLAIDAGRPLTLDESARLSEAFRDSDLPYRVDLVDWHGIDDRFRTLIASQRIPCSRPSATRPIHEDPRDPIENRTLSDLPRHLKPGARSARPVRD